MSETLYESSGLIAGPRPTGALIDNSRFLFLIGLAIDVMLFAGVIGAYFVLRGGTGVWPPRDLPHLHRELVGASTIALALAAFSLCLNLYAQNRNALRMMWTSLMSGLFFLTVFLSLNAIEWKMLLSNGLPIQTVFGGIYLVLTGVFHLHILGSLIYVLSTYRRTLRWRHYTRSSVSIAHLAYFVCTLFVIWLGIYGVVYL